MRRTGARTVLTTGANSGIGLATVLEVARRGFASVGSVRSEAKAEVVRRAARADGLEVGTVLLDVNDAGACREVIGRVQPWGLVNNAGFGGLGAVEDVDDDDAELLLRTMVLAPMRLCRLALPHMRDAGGGRIVNVSSILGRTTAPLAGWYSAAKHALEAVSDALRMEVHSAGVRVVLVEPGGFRTGIWDEVGRDAVRRRSSRYGRAYARSATGLRLGAPALGQPEQVAGVIGRALQARAPLDRYLVGVDARALTLANRWTPVAVQDRLSRLTLGL